jgi:hypothetical protein
MRWVLRLTATGDDAHCLSTDLVEICRPGGLGDIATLGLTLLEAKQLLVSVQRAIVVFPHPAFTKTQLCERQWKVSSRPS